MISYLRSVDVYIYVHRKWWALYDPSVVSSGRSTRNSEHRDMTYLKTMQTFGKIRNSLGDADYSGIQAHHTADEFPYPCFGTAQKRKCWTGTRCERRVNLRRLQNFCRNSCIGMASSRQNVTLYVATSFAERCGSAACSGTPG